MNDSLTKLLTYIEPKILDIQDKREEIISLKYSYQILKELCASKSYLDIINFYDQKFIIDSIKKSSDLDINNYKLYQSSKYLLTNNNLDLQELPQYKNATFYMKKLFSYLNNLYKETELEYFSKEKELKKLELLNKYYLLFNSDNHYLDNVEDFLAFLELVDIPLEDKYKVLIYMTKYNVHFYTLTNDILLIDDIHLSDIKKILDENETINETFNEDLSLDNDILLSLGLDKLKEKRKYLITMIASLYKQKEYKKLAKYYKDFLKLNDDLQELIKQEKYKTRTIVFVRDNNNLLINKYLDKLSDNYKSCIYKNLFDLENSDTLVLPDYKYKNRYYYLKKEFLKKTVYTFLDKGIILVIGVISKGDNLEEFIKENIEFITRTIKDINKYINNNDKDLILKNIKIEDLVLTIDLNTLDMEEENAR